MILYFLESLFTLKLPFKYSNLSHSWFLNSLKITILSCLFEQDEKNNDNNNKIPETIRIVQILQSTNIKLFSFCLESK